MAINTSSTFGVDIICFYFMEINFNCFYLESRELPVILKSILYLNLFLDLLS